MTSVLVIGAGPAGLLAAWVASQRGATVRLMAQGIGTTHILPGWIGVLNDENGTGTSADERGSGLDARLESWIAAHLEHPYGLAGIEALEGGMAAFCAVCKMAGINYAGDLGSNVRLPTALGAVREAALAPESFVAGDLRQPGEMLIAGPAGWRDFYPKLCAENLAGQGFPARWASFDLPEMRGASRFDATPVGLARLFQRADVRERVAAELKPQLSGVARVGLPAVLGLEQSAEVWRDLQDRLGVPLFEIPTLPPSVPGMRIYHAFKRALQQAGVPIWLDMIATGGHVVNGEVTGVVVPTVSREAVYRADEVILATGGLYGGGIGSDHHGIMLETIFNLPVQTPGGLQDWFTDQFLSGKPHAVHAAGVRANGRLQPLDQDGQIVAANLRVAGRLLAGYNPIVEGSNEGVLLATAFRAAQ